MLNFVLSLTQEKKKIKEKTHKQTLRKPHGILQQKKNLLETLCIFIVHLWLKCNHKAISYA